MKTQDALLNFAPIISAELVPTPNGKESRIAIYYDHNRLPKDSSKLPGQIMNEYVRGFIELMAEPVMGMPIMEYDNNVKLGEPRQYYIEIRLSNDEIKKSYEDVNRKRTH